MSNCDLYRDYRTCAIVSLDAIEKNGRIARKCFPDQLILSVLKADAYGHGISGVVPAYDTFTHWYAVATVEEGFRVRALSEKPILLFGPVPEGQMAEAARQGLTFTVGNLPYAEKLNRILEQAGLTATCHLKIDTGLNRSGVRWREDGAAMETIRKIRALKNLRFTGTYTHLACGEGQEPWEIQHTKTQMGRFFACCDAMQKEGFSLGIRHCASTGGALVNPDYRLDMVRLGMLPMGMSYTDESVEELGLEPAMTWVSFVSQVETLRAGEAISYGCTFRAERDMTVGIVTCGYADGYRRVYSNKTSVLVGGKKVPVLGRVAMDYTMINLTEVENPHPGMEVILLGTDGIHKVTAQELSAFGESVSGEVTCVISPRVKRIYRREGEHENV